MSQRFLLTLVADPAIEEPLVDWLLSNEVGHGFTSSQIHGHASEQRDLSLAEQVAGRKRQIRFQMCIEASKLARFVEQLQLEFEGSGIHYWVIPVESEGWL